MRTRLWLPLLAALLALATPLAAQDYDVLLRGGQVLDGTDAQARVADVAIKNGKIARIGNLPNARARTVIDARGLFVTPGFIDMHSHADWGFGEPELNRALNNLTQGITTVVVGQDGRSAWRVGETIGDAIRVWSAQGLAENAILLVGHGSVRREVMGEAERAPTAEELERMRALVRQAMAGGAYGISTGLSYVPGRFSTTEEVIALTREVKPYGGFYISHLRNQGDQLLESVYETIRIGRETGVPVVHSHFKASGWQNFGKARLAMERIAEARAAGVAAWVDVYPWTTSSDGIDVDLLPPAAFTIGRADDSAALPNVPFETMSSEELAAFILAGNGWIRRTTTAGWLAARPRTELLELARGTVRQLLRGSNRQVGRAALLARLQDPVLGDSIRRIIGGALDRRGPELYVIEDAADDRLDGKTLAEAAGLLGVDVVEAAIRLDLMDAHVTHFHMSEPDVEEILGWDFTAISTDGTLPYFGIGIPHPRSYGSFTRLIRHYSLDRQVLALPRAIRAATGLAADMIGLKDRGYVKEGQWADIVALDPKTIDSCATYARPHCYSTGIEYLLVNGVVTLERGRYTGALAGHILTPRAVIPTGIATE
ncbi:MAG: amidohydrolase family protein [Gemmatimonadetes bacterium]|nr:amidohydrolase family protein [Gemmatimonadota bacterium]